jgi:sugar phosphate isomerase/epimerase
MNIGLSTLFFIQDPILKAIEKIHEAGGRYAEVVYEPPHFSLNRVNKGVLKELRGLLDKLGMGRTIHSSFYELNLASDYSEIQALTVRQIKRCLDVCVIIGARVLTIHPGHSPFTEIDYLHTEAKDRFVANLKVLADYANKNGVRLSVENIQSRYFFGYDLEELATLAGEVGGIGITLDVGHAYIMKREKNSKAPEFEIAQSVKAKLAPFLSNVHIHDNMGVKDEHLAIGRGSIDFVPIARAIREINYKGSVTLEAWEPRGSGDLARRGLETARKLFEKY